MKQNVIKILQKNNERYTEEENLFLIISSELNGKRSFEEAITLEIWPYKNLIIRKM